MAWLYKDVKTGEFPGGPAVQDAMLPMQGTRLQFLAGDPRSHELCSAAFEDIDSKLVVTSEEVEEGQYRGGGVEGTKGYKISSRMHCATWRI